MNISKKEWNNYIKKLSAINKKAASLIEAYVDKHGLDDVNGLIDYSNRVVMQYGNASAAMNALMYDTMAELEGIALPAAELAPLPEYGDVAKAVQGTLKTSRNIGEIAGAVSRLVKLTGQDTMLRNGIRDRAQFAWIPSGDTCAFCITLASRGWQNISEKALKNGHAEHIHSNCDCAYMVRHDSSTNVKGYDPDKYREMYDNAEGKTSKDKINSLRREFYAKNKGIVGTASDKAEEFIPRNKFGDVIEFNRKSTDNPRLIEKRQEQEDLIKNLSSQYDTRLKEVKGGAEHAAGDVDITGQIMRLSSSNVEAAIHEFAHTLANTNADKYGLTDDGDFWSEIRKIRTSYRKAVKDDRQKQISTYADSQNILDEFMAEAFTMAKAKELGIALPDTYGSDYTYADMVLKVINKYFKRK